MEQRFAYVAQIQPGDEVAVRRILEHAPDAAMAEHGVQEFTAYVGSGYCVLAFTLPDGDFQTQFAAYTADPRVRAFHTDLAEHFIEGQQIAQPFSAGDDHFHHAAPAADDEEAVTSADLPLAAQVGRRPRT